MRLDKLLANKAFGSRKEVHQIIKDRRVTINGEITTKKDIHIETSSGMTFPQDLSPYSLVIHCGGGMLNEKEMKYRVKEAKRQLRPIVNYGILIAYMNGILERSAEAVPELAFLKENS